MGTVKYVDLDDCCEEECCCCEDVVLTSADRVTILFALLFLLGVVAIVCSPAD